MKYRPQMQLRFRSEAQMEWCRHQDAMPTRDYFRVEDQTGRRFWLYRDGLYGRETDYPRWFVHGVFA